jgi:hypothetical protein
VAGNDPNLLELLKREAVRPDRDYATQALQHYLSFETDKEQRREFIRTLQIPVETADRRRN